jgi:hypothetical protein
MQQTVSKGEFAAIIGVSPGRVSQYLTEGKISTGALVGSGRNAKIDVERAKADLRLTLDVSQLLGNGSDTDLSPSAAETSATGQGASTYAPPELRGTDHEIKLQKLEQIRRVNRNAAIEDAKNAGSLIETVAAKNQMSRIAASLVEMFEGNLTDMAMDLAAAFELPQRDIKHILRKSFRKFRETASRQMAMQSIEIDPIVGTELEAEETEQTAIS